MEDSDSYRTDMGRCNPVPSHKLSITRRGGERPHLGEAIRALREVF
jgi:hypothetical protein